MKADNLRKKKRLFDEAIKKAKERENTGFYEGAALAYVGAVKLLPTDKCPELVIACFNNGGVNYGKAKKYTQAEQYLQRALAVCEKKLGKEHSEAVKTLYNLGNVYAEKKEFDKAEEYYQCVLIIWEKILGKEHLDTAKILRSLGSVYANKKEFDKAEDYYQRTLAIQEKILGKDHPDTAAVLNNLGAIYFDKKGFDKADEYLQRAKKTIAKTDDKNNDSLTKLIDSNYLELKAENARLEYEKLEMKAALHQADRLSYLGRMATMMAHNIKNPINNITTATVSMLMGIKNNGLTSEQLIPSLERVLNNSNRLNETMEQFRNFAQGDRTVLENINLNETIEDIFQLLFVGQYQNHQIKFTREFSELKIMAKTNSFAMQEVLITLLNNAKEAIVDKELKQVTVKTWQKDDKVGFNVEDTGGGIEETKQDKLFSPFFSSKNSGMGLGLYFCKEILKDLDGQIEYYSAPHGAGFRITLPIATEL